jgi:hypothetical protein
MPFGNVLADVTNAPPRVHPDTEDDQYTSTPPKRDPNAAKEVRNLEAVRQKHRRRSLKPQAKTLRDGNKLLEIWMQSVHEEIPMPEHFKLQSGRDSNNLALALASMSNIMEWSIDGGEWSLSEGAYTTVRKNFVNFCSTGVPCRQV